MFSYYVVCVFLALVVTESCSVRLYLHVHHTQSYDNDEKVGQQEVIDTGQYELRRRRRSLDDPEFSRLSADEERAEARDRPSVAQFRKVISDAGLVGGWSVEERGDLDVEQEEEVWKGRREEQQTAKPEKKKTATKEKDPEKKSRMWVLGQLISGAVFGKRQYKTNPSAYAKFASHYGMLVFLPLMIVITVVHILLWYIWFTKKAQTSKESDKASKEPKDDEEDN